MASWRGTRWTRRTMPRRRFVPSKAAAVASTVFFENRHPIEAGMKPQTAAGMDGVLIT